MPRIARLVIPGVPHHIIQRGNRRQRVFFSHEDKSLYLNILDRQAKIAEIQIWAYCLLDNHVHFIAVPRNSHSFSRGIGEAHRRYTSLINTREGWNGYLWQGRFQSFPLGETHLYAAARYIERNPVRANIVKKAEDYPWSSAKPHITGVSNKIISENDPFMSYGNWAEFINQVEKKEDLEIFRKHIKTGRPLGGETFIQKLECITGRAIAIRKAGRKPRIQDSDG